MSALAETADERVPQASTGTSAHGARALAVWLLTAAMAAAAAVLALPAVVQTLVSGVPPARWWVLLAVFAAAEVLVIHVPTTRNAHSHTLREVPAVAGLAFLAPGEYVSAYVVGCGLALVLWSRQRGVKLAFNVSLFALEAAVGLLTYQAVLGAAGPDDPRGWAAAFAGVLVTDLVSAAAVTAALTLAENRFDGEVVRDALGPGVVAAMVNTCLALLVVVLLVSKPDAVPLLGAALLMLVAGYRAHVRLGAGYSRLQHLYRFVGSTERPDTVEDAVAAVLADARQVLRAECAELVVLPDGASPGYRTRAQTAGEPVTEDYVGPNPGDAWWTPATLGEGVLRTVRGSVGNGRSGAGPREGVAAPLRSDGKIYAVLMVTDRSFEGETFGSQDLRLFETLAGHAAVALDKARLLDQLRRMAAQREHEALHDVLTGLRNRRAFHEAVDALTRGGGTGAVLFLDLDHFKDVNGTLGHHAGDALLRETGRRLQAAGGGLVARLGGDEFAVLLHGADRESGVEHARRLHAAVSDPVVVHGLTLSTTASVGLALVPEHGSTGDEMLSHADVAMHAAKSARTGIEVYQPEDGEAVHRKVMLARDLPAAIRQRDFEVWYQPQADAVTRRVLGAEALLRWRHPVYGAVPPPDIVALAERTGLLRELTHAVLRAALEQRATWAAGGFPLTVSVNVTAKDLHDERLPGIVAEMLVATGTPAAALTLEITESGVMSDPGRCLAVLDRLADLGVHLAVDDFGTGYSSLAYLERLPVHEVKIDKSFVQRLQHEASDVTVVRSTIGLTHDLGMHVVAEGVESDLAWSRLEELGCEVVQGYGLSRPLPADAVIPWLRRYSTHLRSRVECSGKNDFKGTPGARTSLQTVP